MPLISFSHAWYLLLLPFLVAGVVYVSRHSLAGLRDARARWSLGLRIAIVTCAVLALAGLQVRQPSRKLAVLFVLDQSNSIPPEQKRQALEFINESARKMGANDAGGVLVFGGDAYLELEPKPVLSLKQIHSQLPRDYTNIAGAVRLALASFPDDAQRRVVLLSDGNENLGSAIQEAAATSSAQVQVDVLPITYNYEREVLLEKMVVPSEAKVGEPFEVRIIARSTERTPAVIRLLRSGELIAQQSVDLLAGPNVINFPQSLDKARFYTYEAVVETKSDQLAENNRALGFVLVRGKPRVLIVENNPRDAIYLATALQGQQLEVDVREPGRLPATLAEFQTYDSIVLSNVGAYQLTPDQMKAIRSSVRDLGAGLVMIGGENSFGPGAYRGTPIEEALPVDMEVKKQKVMPVGAVAMVLHTCEFPDGNRWARETAAAVVDVLGERDKVGVLLYDTGERWGIPMQSAANKEKLKSELYALGPGDMPDFGGIMQMAHDGLVTDAKEAAVKHVIVISDGDPQPPSPELMTKLQ
ncbi:MAG TPA: VWA domain-containing protein, partial [Armatimonadota bacterium]|nr:VWA domain-containing protein [Armatimonadota bacterium]